MGKVRTLQASTGTSAGTVTSIDGTATAKVANYTVTDTDLIRTVLMTTGAASKTVTLPTAANNTNRIITVKKVDSGAGTCIVAGGGAETVDGATTRILYFQYDAVTLHCSGTTWHIIDHKTAMITPWVAYTPASYSGLGSPSASDCWYRRVGDSVELNIKVTVGTVTAAGVQVRMPANLTGATRSTDRLLQGSVATSYAAGIQAGMFPVLASSYPVDIQVCRNDSSGAMAAIGGTSILLNNQILYMTATVPIVEWAFT